MTTVKITIHEGDLRRFMEAQNGPIGLYVQGIAKAVATESRNRSPVKTGKMRQNITSRPGVTGKPYGQSVVANVPYARFVQQGTKPHIIRARRVKYLRFIARDGALVITKSVNHPGIKTPNPFMLDALSAVVRR